MNIIKRADKVALKDQALQETSFLNSSKKRYWMRVYYSPKEGNLTKRRQDERIVGTVEIPPFCLNTGGDQESAFREI